MGDKTQDPGTPLAPLRLEAIHAKHKKCRRSAGQNIFRHGVSKNYCQRDGAHGCCCPFGRKHIVQEDTIPTNQPTRAQKLPVLTEVLFTDPRRTPDPPRRAPVTVAGSGPTWSVADRGGLWSVRGSVRGRTGLGLVADAWRRSLGAPQVKATRIWLEG